MWMYVRVCVCWLVRSPCPDLIRGRPRVSVYHFSIFNWCATSPSPFIPHHIPRDVKPYHRWMVAVRCSVSDTTKFIEFQFFLFVHPPPRALLHCVAWKFIFFCSVFIADGVRGYVLIDLCRWGRKMRDGHLDGDEATLRLLSGKSWLK